MSTSRFETNQSSQRETDVSYFDLSHINSQWNGEKTLVINQNELFHTVKALKAISISTEFCLQTFNKWQSIFVYLSKDSQKRQLEIFAAPVNERIKYNKKA